LLRLDDLLAKQPGVSYQHKMITVEHVLQQNPKNSSAVFALTTQALTQAKWTPAVIEARHENLLAVLHKEWELN